MTHIELAIICILLVPDFFEKMKAHWRPFRNWMERRRIHRESQK